jgi:hypothetical protein
MYAKLVVGASRANGYNCMRDIGRLITSATPSTSLLTGFNAAASTVVDATPAGWTYVGARLVQDQGGIQSAANTTPTTWSTSPNSPNLVFSAPCATDETWIKYAALTTHYPTNSLNYAFALTGATAATSEGVLTNEGPRLGCTTALATTSAVLTGNIQKYLTVDAGDVIHLIANARHLTIISENKGIFGVWESTPTDVNTYYDTAPFIQYSHPWTTRQLKWDKIVPHLSTGGEQTATQGHFHTAFNVYSVADATNYGTYDLNDWGDNSASSTSASTSNRNVGSLLINQTNGLVNTINTSGAVRYVVSPIYYRLDELGYPTQFVTGVCPLYYCNNGIGNSGDTVTINGDEYTFFKCGNFGILAQTS